MRRQVFGRKPMGTVDLDLCFDCKAIWFDAFESPVLSAQAVLELFREIEAEQARPPRPLAEVLRCVACRDRLVLTHDIQRSNRIVYFRCPEGHGRLTTFVQFLREKQFIRSLTPAEIERLKVTVQQVRCSSCGGPVDIARDPVCPYCHAPIAILDADAVREALAELQQNRLPQPTASPVDPSWALDALAAGEGRDGVDLVHDVLSLLTKAF